MNKSKAIQLLKLFDSDDIKRFGEFLESPYFNKNTRVTQLYAELKKHYPEFTSRGVERQRLFKKLFPYKEYNEQVIKNLISELFKLAKEYFAVDTFKKDPFESSLSLIGKLTASKSGIILEKEIELFEKYTAESHQQTEKINLYKYLLEDKKFIHNIFNNRQSEASANLEKSGEYLTFYFLKSILRLSINNHINYFSFNKNIEINFPDMIIKSIDMENFLNYIESLNKEEAVKLKIMYYSLLSISDIQSDESYRNLRALIYGNLENISKDEAQSYLHYMETICAQKINAGKQEYYRELYEIFVREISMNVYGQIPGNITVLKFRNICLAGIRVGEYEWVEKFINDFEDKLQESNRKDIVDLTRAQLNFEKGNFERSLEIISKIIPDQIYFKIDVKNMNLMLLYELEHYEAALSFIESYKKMLIKNPLLTEQYGSKNINFANAVAYLVKIKYGCSVSEKAALIERIKNFSNISNKKWLESKIKELN